MGRKYKEEAIDLAIKHAGHDILEEIAREVPPEGSNGRAFSDSFEKKMEKLIGSEIRRRRAKKVLKITARIAAVILILLIISTAVIFSSEALRTEVLNLFYNKGSISTEIDFSKNSPTNIPEGVILPKYIPDGYKLENIIDQNILYTSMFKNSTDGWFKIQQDKVNMHISANSEGIDSYESEVNGTKVFVVEGKGINMIFFNSDIYTFSISGDIEVPELLKVAGSMIK